MVVQVLVRVSCDVCGAYGPASRHRAGALARARTAGFTRRRAEGARHMIDLCQTHS